MQAVVRIKKLAVRQVLCSKAQRQQSRPGCTVQYVHYNQPNSGEDSLQRSTGRRSLVAEGVNEAGWANSDADVEATNDAASSGARLGELRNREGVHELQRRLDGLHGELFHMRGKNNTRKLVSQRKGRK